MIRKKNLNINNPDGREQGNENMADKELRRLSRRELLRMLLVQCEETERLQQETDEMKEHMETVMESYKRLKKKLDIKDERLNQKDAKIAELSCRIAELEAAEETAAEENGSIAEAFRRLDEVNEVFEEVKKTVEQYIRGGKTRTAKETPFLSERPAGIRKKQSLSGSGRIVPMNPGRSKSGVDRNAASEGTEKSGGITAVAGGIYG